MGHVATANGESVAVTARHEDEQVGFRQLNALSDRQRAAMDAVEAIGRRVPRDTARATDAAHEGNLVRRPIDGGKRAVNTLEHTEVAAAWTPDGLEVALVIFGLERRQGGRHRVNPPKEFSVVAEERFSFSAWA